MRGRPKGSRTKVITPAMRRACDYVDALAGGTRPAAAASAVAVAYQVDDSTVFRDVKRHMFKLAREAVVSDARQSGNPVDRALVSRSILLVLSIIREEFDSFPQRASLKFARISDADLIRNALHEDLNVTLKRLAERILTHNEIHPAVARGTARGLAGLVKQLTASKLTS